MVSDTLLVNDWCFITLCVLSPSDFGYERKDGELNCEVSPEFEDKELELCINGREEEIKTKGWVKSEVFVFDINFDSSSIVI